MTTQDPKNEGGISGNDILDAVTDMGSEGRAWPVQIRLSTGQYVIVHELEFDDQGLILRVDVPTQTPTRLSPRPPAEAVIAVEIREGFGGSAGGFTVGKETPLPHGRPMGPRPRIGRIASVMDPLLGLAVGVFDMDDALVLTLPVDAVAAVTYAPSKGENA